MDFAAGEGMSRSRNWQLTPRLALAAATALVAASGCHRAVSLLPPAELIATVAAGEVVGLVTDAHSGAPLAGVIVQLLPSGLHASTDTTGRFRLGPAPEGRYQLRVLRIGYVGRADSLVLGPTNGAAVAVRLSRTIVRLETLTASAGMRR